MEVGTPVVNHIFTRKPPARFAVLTAGIGEVVSVFVRKRTRGVISAADCAQAQVNLTVEIVYPAAVLHQAVDLPLVSAALPFIDTHSVNGTDAIVLRSALDLDVAARTGGDAVVLVASDTRLVRAARAEGLVAFNPEVESAADFDALTP